MKRKIRKRSNKSRETSKMKGSLVGKAFMLPPHNHQLPNSSLSANPYLFRNLLQAEAANPQPKHALEVDADADPDTGDKDFILSQDFFCTPDYITPDNQHQLNSLDCNEDHDTPCPKSPEKLTTIKSKRFRQEPETDAPDADEVKMGKAGGDTSERTKNYVSQSAVALRCRVMPPSCIKNPYLRNVSNNDIDPFRNQRSKCAGFFPAVIGGDGLSRYLTDFHEIEQIGTGNFSRVFKVLKRIDGCMYAVKHSTRHLHQDTERRKALMEVQTLGALGFHENVVGYYSSWFETDQLYIQLELCDYSLSRKSSHVLTEGEALVVLHQVAKALQFIHARGIAHLDVKPDNIYIKNETYKLGDFGCATLFDKSLPIEEGDARYMPNEILNENYDHLDKADIFSLAVSVYELIRGSPLAESGLHFLNLREGKLPLLPGHSLPLQNLLKVMVDPDPTRRPSAQELVKNPIFERIQKNTNS